MKKIKFECPECGDFFEQDEDEAHNNYEVFGLPICDNCNIEMIVE